ncbi:MAG: ABC transporter ATP-binding protein [Roseinatronobacter sp.]
MSSSLAARPRALRTPDTDALLSVVGLSKRFATGGTVAAEALSLSLHDGEMLALLGPSGCGKTTFLRLLAGFERPDAGQILLRGRDVTDDLPEQRGIGFVFQDYALFPHLNVFENVKFGLRRRPVADATARAQAMLDLVGLGALGARKPHELSGGQQQRVALARTLAVAPPLVLLDEPFSNLDTALRVETRQDVRGLLKAAGSAAILVTHDQEEAMAVADRIAVMRAGRLEQIGTPDAVYRTPVSEFVAAVMGRANFVMGMAEGDVAQTDFGPLPLSRPAQGPVSLSLRPEQILLSADPAGPAWITAREFRGHDQLFWVQDGTRHLMVLSGAEVGLAVGTRVRLRVRDCVAPLA